MARKVFMIRMNSFVVPRHFSCLLIRSWWTEGNFIVGLGVVAFSPLGELLLLTRGCRYTFLTTIVE